MVKNMKLREFLKSGIIIEGYRIVQCWETEDCPTIYFEGTDSGEEELEEYMERKVAYIFTIVNGDNMPCLVIELAE